MQCNAMQCNVMYTSAAEYGWNASAAHSNRHGELPEAPGGFPEAPGEFPDGGLPEGFTESARRRLPEGSRTLQGSPRGLPEDTRRIPGALGGLPEALRFTLHRDSCFGTRSSG